MNEKKTIINLPIHENCFFEINIPRHNLQNLYPYDLIKIIFFCNEKEYIVFNDFALFAIQALQCCVKEIMKNKFQLHNSITKDIGYVWNEYLHADITNKSKFIREDNFWVGNKHHVWEGPGTATWLYQKNNKIYLEINSFYPWHFSDPEPGENYISYEEFMQNYEPYAIIELDKETIKQWLEQTEELLAIMNANEEKAEKEYEAKQQKN